MHQTFAKASHRVCWLVSSLDLIRLYKVCATALLIHCTNIQLRPHLVYLILVEWYVSSCYFLSHLHQVFLDVLHNDISTLVRQDLTDHIAARTEERTCKIVNMLSC